MGGEVEHPSFHEASLEHGSLRVVKLFTLSLEQVFQETYMEAARLLITCLRSPEMLLLLNFII